MKYNMHQLILKSFLLLFISCLSFSSFGDSSIRTERVSQGQTLPLEDLQVFTEVFSIIRQSYVEDVSDTQLFESAIEGMLSQLDPHSAYLSQNQLTELVETTRGNFSGIGLRLQKEEDFLIVDQVISNTPAAKSGILEGDLILKINSAATDGLSLSQASQLLKGEDGTGVKLTVLTPSTNETRSVKLKRERITYLNVEAKSLEPQYEYIRIGGFQENTAEKIRDLLLSYQSKPIRGLIIDLRNNPGGLLTSAVDVVDLFVHDGIIVYTQGRGNNSRQEYLATETDLSKNMGVAVLINQNSASAAEIVAGALQDKQRAIIVGTTSFGKGSVQTVIPITGNRAVKLTTSLYYTPSGKVININGITPDIEIENDFSKAALDAQLSAALNALKGTALQQEKEAADYLQPID